MNKELGPVSSYGGDQVFCRMTSNDLVLACPAGTTRAWGDVQSDMGWYPAADAAHCHHACARVWNGYGCKTFKYSVAYGQCGLDSNAVPTSREPSKFDTPVCVSTDAVPAHFRCPSGTKMHLGDVQGSWGSIGWSYRWNAEACRDHCRATSGCRSFEYSARTYVCNANYEAVSSFACRCSLLVAAACSGSPSRCHSTCLRRACAVPCLLPVPSRDNRNALFHPMHARSRLQEPTYGHFEDYAFCELL